MTANGEDQRRAASASPLDRAVDEALDAGRDPSTDDAVLAALVDEPERFGEVMRLADDARALATTNAFAAAVRSAARSAARPAERAARRRRTTLVVLAAAAAALALAPFLLPDRAVRDVDERVGAGGAVGELGDGLGGGAEPAREPGSAAERTDAFPRVANAEPRPSTSASGVDELRVAVTSGPWRPAADRPTNGAVLTRGPSDTTTILRTVHGIAPDGSRITFTHTQTLR